MLKESFGSLPWSYRSLTQSSYMRKDFSHVAENVSGIVPGNILTKLASIAQSRSILSDWRKVNIHYL